MKLSIFVFIYLFSLVKASNTCLEYFSTTFEMINAKCVDENTDLYVNLLRERFSIYKKLTELGRKCEENEFDQMMMQIINGEEISVRESECGRFYCWRRPTAGEVANQNEQELPKETEEMMTSSAVNLKNALISCFEMRTAGQDDRRLDFEDRLKKCLSGVFNEENAVNYKNAFLNVLSAALAHEFELPSKLKSKFFWQVLDRTRNLPADAEQSSTKFAQDIQPILNDIASVLDYHSKFDGFIARLKKCTAESSLKHGSQSHGEFASTFHGCLMQLKEVPVLTSQDIKALQMEKIASRVIGHYHYILPNMPPFTVQNGRILEEHVNQRVTEARKKLRHSVGRRLWLKSINQARLLARNQEAQHFCPICSDLIEKDLCCRLPCGDGHDAHFACLQEWATMHFPPSCPLCRKDIDLL